MIARNIRLGATIEGLVRKEKYELPPEAIREMIINAHCHRNFLYESCIQVAVYDDRLEVTSSGSVKNVGVEDTPRISEPLSFFEKTLFSSAPTGVSHR